VFGPYIACLHPIGFVGRELEYAFRLGTEWDFDRLGKPLSGRRPGFDVFSKTLQELIECSENPAGNAVPFSRYAKQDVLGLDRRRTKLTGFIPGEEESPPRLLGVPLEQRGLLSALGRLRVRLT
jgi:hypothetical protein